MTTVRHEQVEDINVPRVMKKEAIRWVVPAGLALICLCLVIAARVQVQDMLVNYQTKEQAEKDKKESDIKIEGIQNQIAAYSKLIADQQATLIVMDKKLDHLQYVMEFAQEHNRLSGPKAKDGP